MIHLEQLICDSRAEEGRWPFGKELIKHKMKQSQDQKKYHARLKLCE